MSGRAGRTGFTNIGESILLCENSDKTKVGKKIFNIIIDWFLRIECIFYGFKFRRFSTY